MTYKLFEHNRAKKFLKKHEQNKKLLLRINKEYKNILKNPYNSAYKELIVLNVLNVIEQE